MDDLYSLVCVAFFFIYNELPWLEKGFLGSKSDQSHKYQHQFTEQRWNKRHQTDKKLIAESKELRGLFSCLQKMRAEINREKEEFKSSRFNQKVNYDKLLQMIPKFSPISKGLMLRLMLKFDGLSNSRE